MVVNSLLMVLVSLHIIPSKQNKLFDVHKFTLNLDKINFMNFLLIIKLH